MADTALLRDVTIKTGIVKRSIKELCFYEGEVEKNSSTLQAMKAQNNVDEHHIKKQAELLEESKQMVPESHRRLVRYLEELKKLIEDHESALHGTPQYAAAKEQVETATEHCSKINEASAN